MDEQELSSNQEEQQESAMKIGQLVPTIKRTGALASSKNMELLRNVDDLLHIQCLTGKEKQQDGYLSNVHDYFMSKGQPDIAFIVYSFRNIHFVTDSKYDGVLAKFEEQQQDLECTANIQNRPFIDAGLCQKMARIFLRMEQPDTALKLLKQAQRSLHNAEPCEWTGNLLQSLGTATMFLYFMELDSPTAFIIRLEAHQYYKQSYDHFCRDDNPNTYVKRIQMLLCMFNTHINIYLFMHRHYWKFFSEKVSGENLTEAVQILQKIRHSFTEFDHSRHWPEILMDILVNQALLMIRSTQTMSKLKDKLCSVSTIILEAQTDLLAFNMKVSKNNPAMIKQCHEVYQQLIVCLLSYTRYITQYSSTEVLEEVYHHWPLCPVLQIELYHIKEDRSSILSDYSTDSEYDSDIL